MVWLSVSGLLFYGCGAGAASAPRTAYHCPMSEPSAEFLGNPLPAEPLMLASEWLAEAWRRRLQPNPNAMTLATATLEGWPAARIVLCKDVVGVPGYVVFYTNFQSRKGLELATQSARRGRACTGTTCTGRCGSRGWWRPAPAADSDAYFASRARESRIGAWASAQSQPGRPPARRCWHRCTRPPSASPRVRSPGPASGAATGCGPKPSSCGWRARPASMIGRAGPAPWTRAPDGSMQPGPWSVTRLQP